MAYPPPKPKKPPVENDFAALLGDDVGTGDAVDDDEEFDSVDDEDMPEDEMPADPMTEDTGIDPEVAGLATRLGFDQPDQQQALVDLIKLVMGPAPLEIEEEPLVAPMSSGSEMGF